MATKSIHGAALTARWVALRLELWVRARILAFQITRDQPLAAMLELATPTARRRYTGMPAAKIVRAVRRTLRRPLLMRKRPCLREGLLAYRFLAEAGYRPYLHFGVDPAIVTSPSAIAHCWVTLDGKIVIGESQTPFVGILSHPEGAIEGVSRQ